MNLKRTNLFTNTTIALLILLTTSLKAQTLWYYNGTGAINDVASWGTNTNGTGGSLTDFTSGGRYFYIQNTTSVTLSGTWTVGSALFASAAAGGDSVIIGNPTTAIPAITFTLLAGSNFTVFPARVVSVAAASGSLNNKIIYQNATPISFGTILDTNMELVYDNTTITTSTSSTFGNISVINNATVNMGGAAITVKNVTVDAGSTLIGSIGASSNYIAVKNTGIVTINGTCRAGRPGGLFTASNSPFPSAVTANGTFIFQDAVTVGTNLILGANSTIEYNRGTSGQTSNQTITALNYGNLILSNSGAFTSNKIFATTGVINVAGTMSINLFTGSTVATPAAGFTINILPSGRFVINSASAFGTTASTNQRIFLRSDATGTASLGIMASGASFAGSINIEKFIPSGFRKYRFISHPFTASQPLSELTGEIDVTGNPAGTTGVAGQTTSTGFTTTLTNNPSAYYFNTATSNGATPNDGGWLAFVDNTTTTNWPRGRGIRVLTRGTKGQTATLDGSDATPNAVTYTMNGTANVGAVAIAMANSGTGLNLMGNPYASAIDVGAVLTAALPGTNIANLFYVRNPQTESYITISPIPANYTIPAYSAFFVQALTASNLNFTEANKTICTSCPVVFRANQTNQRLEIKAYKDEVEYDNLIFNFNPAFSQAYEKTTDAVKLFNNGFNIYSITLGKIKLAANSLPLQSNTVIPLGISLPTNKGVQTYTLKVIDFSINPGKKMVLYDKLLNKKVELSSTLVYNLTIDPANKRSMSDDRLTLLIEN